MSGIGLNDDDDLSAVLAISLVVWFRSFTAVALFKAVVGLAALPGSVGLGLSVSR